MEDYIAMKRHKGPVQCPKVLQCLEVEDHCSRSLRNSSYVIYPYSMTAVCGVTVMCCWDSAEMNTEKAQLTSLGSEWPAGADAGGKAGQRHASGEVRCATVILTTFI